jgi:hypothetical protein
MQHAALSLSHPSLSSLDHSHSLGLSFSVTDVETSAVYEQRLLIALSPIERCASSSP